MKIVIAFTVKNCVEYTIEAIKSLRTTKPHYILIVDDFSTDGTKEWLSEFMESWRSWENLSETIDIKLVTDPDTDSLSAKWNMSLEFAEENECGATLICNNDILFAPDTIDRLVEKMEESDETVGMVTGNNVRDSVSPKDILEYQVSKEEGTEAESPDFSCFLIRVSAWHKIGKFDTNYKPCYFEDNDTHSMMKVHGIKALNLTYAPYYHYGSRTQNSVPGGVCTPQEFERNKTYYIKKFGAMPALFNLKRAKRRLGIKDG